MEGQGAETTDPSPAGFAQSLEPVAVQRVFAALSHPDPTHIFADDLGGTWQFSHFFSDSNLIRARSAFTLRVKVLQGEKFTVSRYFSALYQIRTSGWPARGHRCV
jgi:hypothetical protein